MALFVVDVMVISYVPLRAMVTNSVLTILEISNVPPGRGAFAYARRFH